VGKDLVARLIHANSRRRTRPFVPVNCATIPDELWESECFGSVEGAFTGARRWEGLFRQAEGGTLFLDELQELSRRHQAKLKEFIQYQRLRPVGASRVIKLNVRIIVASNRNLEQMVQEKQFAQDLFRRLGRSVIQIPPLRERREDIPALVEYFLERLSRRHEVPAKGLTVEAERVLMVQPWPENVGQLQSVVEAAWIRSPGPKVDVADVARTLAAWDGQGPPLQANHNHTQTLIRAIEEQGLKPVIQAYEREAVEQLLATSPSLQETARRAKVRLSTLQYKIKKFGLKGRRS
jgi:transcriptional regulator of aroF, aroG, tyrA and aromatic amino acid transport